MMKVTIVGTKFPHHGPFSGYDRLVEFVHPESIISTRAYDKLLEALSGLPHPLRMLGRGIVGRKWHWAEARALMHSRGLTRRVFHFIYAENHYRNFWRFKGQNRIVCSFHQPPKYFDRENGPGDAEKYRHIDGTIVLSSELVPVLKRLTRKEDVYFIPHGVDTTYFHPLKSAVRANRVLIVGNWGRDFTLAAAVARELAQRRQDIAFEVVTLPSAHAYFKGLLNVRCRSSVVDDDLVRLYQTSRLLFLPLKACAANNAILEAMACGLPILASDLPGTRDYLPPIEDLFFDDRDITKISRRIERIIDDEERNRVLSGELRQRAEVLTWERIARKVLQAYDEVCASRPK